MSKTPTSDPEASVHRPTLLKGVASGSETADRLWGVVPSNTTRVPSTSEGTSLNEQDLRTVRHSVATMSRLR